MSHGRCDGAAQRSAATDIRPAPQCPTKPLPSIGRPRCLHERRHRRVTATLIVSEGANTMGLARTRLRNHLRGPASIPACRDDGRRPRLRERAGTCNGKRIVAVEDRRGAHLVCERDSDRLPSGDQLPKQSARPIASRRRSWHRRAAQAAPCPVESCGRPRWGRVPRDSRSVWGLALRRKPSIRLEGAVVGRGRVPETGSC